MATSSRFILPIMVAVLMLLTMLGSARRLEGEKWTGGESASGEAEHPPVIQFAKHLYLQQLPAGPSCQSSNKNNPPCHH
ncbi:unnamed protein product [Urochloa decumbens]|uniref:Uncharacterized protein n=1 Tax=Urochloa decumbens TaxID=240449 RepID=A0ABC9CEK3_9POAL